jgi:exodeoxyribonuclease V beta subunit
VTPLDPLAVPLGGTQLIEASAGTGKTHTLTTLYVRLLVERRLEPSKILVVTFTNAATAELKDRIRRRVRDALLAFEGRGGDPELEELSRRSTDRKADAQHLREMLGRLDEAAVLTIHGFCQRVLVEHAFESGAAFDLDLCTFDLPLLLEVAADFWSRELSGASHAEVRYLLRSQGFSGLVSLARLATQWPETPIGPAARGLLTGPAVAAFVDAREQLRDSWESSQTEVERLLRSAGLYKKVSSPEALEKTRRALGQLLSRRDESIDDFTSEVAALASSALARSTRKGHAPPAHPFFDRVEELCLAHAQAAEALGDWLLGLQQRLVASVRRELPRLKDEQGVLTFDDLLHQVDRALHSGSAAQLAARLRERHAVALVDEFQDTDPVQYRIFHRIFGAPGGALFLIGDPKQAIYAFRGADLFAYLEAARSADCSPHSLGTNWRSDPTLVTAVNTLFGRVERPFLLDDIAYHPIRPRPGAEDRAPAGCEFVFVPRTLARAGERITKGWGEAELPALVAAHVSRLLASDLTIEGRRVGPGDLAILTRSNRQAREVQLALRALSIPTVMHGDSSVLDAPEASELARVLDALAEPANAASVRAALATPLVGLSAEAIDRLREDEAEWEAWMDGFSRWHATWDRQGFIQAFRRLIREKRVASRLLSLVDGDRRLTNLLHLAEILHQEASRRRLGIPGLLAWFSEVRFDQTKRDGIASEAQQIRLERDDRAVQLTTMHRSKGLEYPIVYCPYLWTEGSLFSEDKRLCRYHDPESGYRLKIDIGNKESKAQALELAEREARSESLRLAYVALTRARHKAIVFWGAFRQTTSPLTYLLHPGDPGRKDADLLADLARLSDAAPGAFEIREVDPGPGVPYSPPGASPVTLTARKFSRRLGRAWRSSSFSALAAHAEALSLPAVLGRDVDEAIGEALASETTSEQPVALDLFPRGARAGDLLHFVLENLDFSAEPPEIEPEVARALDRHGFDPKWREPLGSAIFEILRTPLRPGLRLCDVPAARRLSELEFVFPVARPDGSRGVTASQIAELLERHPDPAIPASTIERVARLGFEPLAGFLRGFIDLVFEANGQFLIADYKSNHLGSRSIDYRAERMALEMERHHYTLQYLIYTVAVHRYLAHRLPGYDYDRSFAGVLYLFLRGMSPATGPERGIFFARPPRALIEALSGLLGGGS